MASIIFLKVEIQETMKKNGGENSGTVACKRYHERHHEVCLRSLDSIRALRLGNLIPGLPILLIVRERKELGYVRGMREEGH